MVFKKKLKFFVEVLIIFLFKKFNKIYMNNNCFCKENEKRKIKNNFFVWLLLFI